MADIPVKLYRLSGVRPNTSPINPSTPVGETPVIINPGGGFGGVGAGLSLDSVNRVQLGFQDYAGNRTIRLSEWEDSSVAELVSTTSDGIIYQNLSKFSEGNTQFYTNLVNNVGAGSARFSIATNGDTSSIKLLRNSDLGGQELSFAQASDGYLITLADYINSKGIEYFDDYESNFTARSLVTKQYVDGAVSGAAISIGSPANGLSLAGTVLSLGLASSGVTGALSGSDWSTFNNKENAITAGTTAQYWRGDKTFQDLGTDVRGSLLTGYTVGTNTPISSANTILSAFQNVQGQINARVSGTIASGQVAFGTGVNTVGGSNNFFYNTTSNCFSLNYGTNPQFILHVHNPATGAGSTSYVHYTNANVGALTTRGFSLGLGGDNAGYLILRENNPMFFATNGTVRWEITATGELRGRSSNTITTLSNGNLFISPNGTGSVLVGPSATPTNTLDVNGTTRIRTISNLGSTATRFLVASATGVISERTGAEMRTDISAVPTTRTLTINGTALDLSADRSWTIGADGNKVSYNVADSKTPSERLQARVNIGSTSATPQVITTAGAINDLAVTSNHLVFTGASVVLSGIVAGLDGEEITILNASGTNLELLSQSALSTDSNRFASGVIVPNLSIVRIKYRTTTARWVLENVGINDGRYVRKDVADTKSGNLTLTNAAIINGHIDVNGSTSASPGVALNRFRNAVAGSGITQFFGTNGGSSRQHFAFYGSGDVEYISLGNGWVSSGTPTLRAVNTILLEQNAVSNIRSNASNRLTRRDELYLNYSQTVATTGTINDLAINVDCKLLILTGATDLTGVVPVDNTRLLRIESRGGSRIIRDQSTSSTDVNRFALGADLTINAGEVYQFIYTDSRWRRVL